MEIEYTTQIHREGALYVAHAPQLDVSSAGSTAEEADEHLREAVALFIEEATRMGTLDQILEEAGYRRVGADWLPPDVITSTRSRLAIHAAAR